LLALLDGATAGVRRFTADASHQMRTPLSVLKLQVTLARQGSADALGEISDAVDRLERLLTQLLSLARAQEAGQSTPIEAVDLREVCTRVVTRRYGQAMEAGVDVRLDAPEREGPIVQGHRALVFELLSNLVDNAIRYNRRGGEVALSITRAPGAAIVSVEDDGPGIAAPDRDRAFERFVRLDTPERREGSGLGLAIVQSIATRIGATITLADGDAGGLLVRVRLPIMAPSPRGKRP
jgi:two-component system sensor histidine kinase TctE